MQNANIRNSKNTKNGFSQRGRNYALSHFPSVEGIMHGNISPAWGETGGASKASGAQETRLLDRNQTIRQKPEGILGNRHESKRI